MKHASERELERVGPTSRMALSNRMDIWTHGCVSHSLCLSVHGLAWRGLACTANVTQICHSPHLQNTPRKAHVLQLGQSVIPTQQPMQVSLSLFPLTLTGGFEHHMWRTRERAVCTKSGGGQKSHTRETHHNKHSKVPPQPTFRATSTVTSSFLL